jgi:hypothetical protein
MALQPFFSPVGNTENIALFFPLCCKILGSGFGLQLRFFKKKSWIWISIEIKS